jgi:eukaryotic-like serine/threonine-protein kinase
MARPGDVASSTPSSPATYGDTGGQPSRIGPYRILRQLGRGGMGVVYLAEQTEPVRREVAIKVLSNGVDSDVFVARFEAERQTLAMMEHPNITNVFDAGVTDAGLPYFVMERVDGVPLNEYADAHRLGIEDRISLFLQVCRAVQHAHQKGVIHRDLKPSNVIVAETDGGPVCKVIDFGIAKTVGAAEAARLTMTGISLGTPAYMSPEQARGDIDVDTRTDVYALGVTLYELLAGVLPFESKSSFAMMMATQHGDARAPSQRFAALPVDEQKIVTYARAVDAVTLRRELQEDLDWVVLKSIENDRELRYHSANELAADLGRHFANQPVSVGPPSGRYRARKFIRRHRLSVAFAATTALLLVGFSIAVTVQARRIAGARNTAELRQGQAEELIGFMVGDLRTRLAAVGRIEMLDEVSQKAMDYFAAVPEKDLSNTELFRRSQALSQLGEVRMSQGKLDAATTAFRQSLALAEGLSQRDSLNGEWQLGLGASHYWVGYMHFRHNDLDSAMSHFASYLHITERLVARSPDSLTYRNEMSQAESNVGSTKEAMGDLPGALAAYRATVRIIEDLVRRDSTKLEWRSDLGNNYNKVGVIQTKLGDLAGAEQSHRSELAVKQSIAAHDSANKTYRERVALAQAFLGNLLIVEGRPADALTPLTDSRNAYAALAAFDTANPERRRLFANADGLLGVLAVERGDAAEAMRRFTSSRTVMDSLVTRSPSNALWQYGLSRWLTYLGATDLVLHRQGDAATSERRALSIIEPALQKKPTDLNFRVAQTEAYLTLGEALARDGRGADANAAWMLAYTTIDSLARARQLTDHLALQASALMHLDRLEEVRPIVAELLRRGYRRPSWMAVVREKHAGPAS